MSTMRAAILYGAEDVRIESVPIPPVGSGEIRVQIGAALTCGTDVKVFTRGYHARMLTPPCPFGHEMAGEVEAVGEGVTAWKPGDRVVAANSAPCGECFYCRRDQPELCEDLLFVNGAFAEYITLPERIVRTNILPVPRELSLKAAAMVEPLACVVHGIEETAVESGQVVAVIGTGSIGLLFVRLCKLAGASVIAVGRNGARLELAVRVGADAVVNAAESNPVNAVRGIANGGRGPDRVIECVGARETWEQSVAMVRKGGVVNLFGGCPSGTQICFDAGRLHYDSLKIVSTFHHTPSAVRKALALLQNGQIPVELVISDSAPLSDLPEVMVELARGGSHRKVAIYASGSGQDSAPP